MLDASRPPISVVVPTRNRPDALARCLDIVAAQLREDDELLVVDSASTDGTTASVASAAGARVVRADRRGSSLARNIGWRSARHDLVAFTDDDVHVLPGWLDAIAQALLRDDTWFVTGWIGVAPEQSHVPEPNPILLRPDPLVLDRSAVGALGATANCGFRREALEAVDGFDEQIGPGTWYAAGEDQELFDRLVAAGLVGFYDPGARVYHDQWRSRKDAVRLHWRYGKGMGARLALLRPLDRMRWRRVVREALWDDCAVGMWKALRAGFQTGVVFAVLRLAGTVVGYVVARSGVVPAGRQSRPNRVLSRSPRD
jgi:glycosyltransferase involved in cell wall biosynthesis